MTVRTHKMLGWTAIACAAIAFAWALLAPAFAGFGEGLVPSACGGACEERQRQAEAAAEREAMIVGLVGAALAVAGLAFLLTRPKSKP